MAFACNHDEWVPGLQLYEHICDEQECTDIGCSNPEVPATVLLKPEEYEIVDEARLPELVKLLSVGQLKGSPVGGLTFGVHVPEVKKRGQRVSYPSGPTWQVRTLPHPSWHRGRALLSQLKGSLADVPHPPWRSCKAEGMKSNSACGRQGTPNARLEKARMDFL